MGNKSRENYKNEEDKLLIAKIEDKYDFSKTKNKITYTDFLNVQEKSVAVKYLQENRITNYTFYGVREEPDRCLLIFYPDKLTEEQLKKNYNLILSVIRIKLPNELSYEHKDYLSGIMKLGLRREKFGDIIVTDSGADIIVLKEVEKTILYGLQDLTRFKKSTITIVDISEIENMTTEFEEVSIIVTSNRLDNFVSEICRCSRTRASEIIEEGRVYINYNNELKDSKKININDIINVRGYGKYIFDGYERNTKSGRYVLNLRKYI